jgi:hypothetical protein
MANSKRWLPAEVRFWANVHQTDGCWLWTAGTNKQGYGRLHIAGKATLAHRFSWTIANGVVPDRLCVLHHCDTPPCVRPDHLFLGTRQDNDTDKILKDRVPRGERAGPARLTEQQVL